MISQNPSTVILERFDGDSRGSHKIPLPLFSGRFTSVRRKGPKKDGQVIFPSGPIKSLFSAIVEPIIDPYTNSVVAGKSSTWMR
jgi:hypothetical protein